MSFNNRVIKSYAQGGAGVTISSFAAPWTAFKGILLPLNTAAPGTVSSSVGLTISMPSPQYDIEWDSLSANVQVAITTSTIVINTVWQVSNDNVGWVTLYPMNGAAYVAPAPAGSGSPVTTSYIHACPGFNAPYQYLRMAVINTVASGGGADNVIVSYNFRKRWVA